MYIETFCPSLFLAPAGGERYMMLYVGLKINDRAYKALLQEYIPLKLTPMG